LGGILNVKGCLYIVATPIGNLKDISLRALEILREVDCIAAEDTRHSAFLLNHYGVNVPLISLHDHNEREQCEGLLQRLQQGQRIALISDAGTPLISDPGFVTVRAARLAGFPVVPIPGAVAAITALCASGLPTDKFVFEGFLPHKHTARCQQLKKNQEEVRTLIFYESPHRIVETIEDMKTLLGEEREAVIARELTKTFETFFSGTLARIAEWLQESSDNQRGEFVVIVRGKTQAKDEEKLLDAHSEEVLAILLAELPLKQAVSLAAQITGKRKNDLYQWAIKQKPE
jgi:16S rRNA (cytidine1402-2'-O)-methyltransferase